MNIIKVRIDFNMDPAASNCAKQVIISEDNRKEIFPQNIIGLKIINVELEKLHNCLILTLGDDIKYYPEPLENIPLDMKTKSDLEKNDEK